MATTKANRTRTRKIALEPDELIKAAVGAAQQLQRKSAEAHLFPHGIHEIHLQLESAVYKLDIRLTGNSAPVVSEVSGLRAAELTEREEVRLRAETTPGIDVSHHNGNVNWELIAGSGHRYVFLKATEGASFGDSRFGANWSGSRAAGLLRGAYHYFRPSVAVSPQVDNFVGAVGTLEETDIPPVLDLEERSGWTVSVPERASLVRDWLIRVHERLQCRPIVYTSKSFMHDVLGDSNELAPYPLWVAHYTTASSPNMPSAWSSWQFWQYSDSGTAPGVTGPVDLNRFAGTFGELEQFVADQHHSRPEET